MPKKTFNREAYLAGNKAAKEFSNVKTGIYFCKLYRCYHKTSDAGHYNSIWVWQITDENEDHVGQCITKSFKLEDKEEGIQDKGYKWLAIELSRFNYDMDTNGDPEEFYETIIDIKARIDWTAPTDDDIYSKLVIKDVLGDFDEVDSNTTDDDDDELDIDEEDVVNVAVGDYIWLLDERIMKVVAEMAKDDPNNTLKQDHLIGYQAHKSMSDIEPIFVENVQGILTEEQGDIVAKAKKYNFPTLESIEDICTKEEEEEEEEEGEINWEIGTFVQGESVKNPGKKHRGEIKELLPEEGLVKIRKPKNKEGKVFVVTCKIDSLVLAVNAVD